MGDSVKAVLSRKSSTVIAVIAALVLFGLPGLPAGVKAEQCPPCSVRTLQPAASPASALAPGYCSSIGGSHLYEYIQNVSYNRTSESTLSITVYIYIANPTGCTYGDPCPEYDNSPEYVNAWIDWDGDRIFEADERVLDADLTGYLGINYHGTMSTSDIVTIPQGAIQSPWMRVNLGWGFDPNDPCEYSWTWGDVSDQEVKLQAEIEDFRVVGGLGQYEGKFKDRVFRRGSDGPSPRFDVTISGPKSKVQIDITRKSVVVSSLEAVWDPIENIYRAMWNDMEDNAEVGEYLARAKVVTEAGDELDSSNDEKFYVIFDIPSGLGSLERRSFLYDDAATRDESAVWFMSSEQKLLLWRYGRDAAAVYHLHPFSERIVDIAISQVDGKTSRDVAVAVLSEWALPYGRDLRLPGECKYTGPLPPDKYFRYSTCTKENDTFSLLDRADRQAQCSDSACMLTALLRAVGIAAHPVTADADEKRAGWRYDTWIEAFPSANWTAYHPHEGLGPNSRIDAGTSWGAIWDKAHNDIVIMGDADWDAGDLDDSDADVKFGYTNGEPNENFDLIRDWITELSQDYWGEPHHSWNAGILAADGTSPDSLRLSVKLDKSEYELGDTLRVDVTILNLSSAPATSSLTIGVMSDDLRTMMLGDETLYSVDETVTVPGHDSLTVGETYVLPMDLSSTSDYYVEARSVNELSRASLAVVPRLAVSVDVPDQVDVDNAPQFTFNATISNESDYAVTSLVTCVESSRNLTIVEPCKGPLTLPPHSISTLQWDAQAHGRGIATLYIKTTSADGGGSEVAASTRLLSATGLDVVDDCVSYDTVSGGPLQVSFEVRNNGDFPCEGVSVNMTLPDEIDATVTHWDVSALAPGEETELDSWITFVEGKEFVLNILATDDAGHSAAGIVLVVANEKLPPLITLTGHYSDHLYDANADGTYDLTVDVGVISETPGLCVLKARLVDVGQQEILWAKNTVEVEGGNPILIPLHFDGEVIFNHGVNGPYYVRDVYVYHTGEPSRSDYAAEAHTTQPYDYRRFSSNVPPEARCKDVTALASASCDTDASIDDGSFDPDGDPITMTQSPLGPYPLGTTLVTLTVEDDKGGVATCTGTVTVNDVTPPELSATLNRDVLWPPNHTMVDITATVGIRDNCCAAPTFRLVAITSNEPDNGKGDGDTVGDIQGADYGTDDTSFQLRSERSGRGDGRIYTIVYEAEDCSGNTATATAEVRVPHDRGGFAFASMGYDPSGSAFDPKSDRFVVIIPSRRAEYGVDASGKQVLLAEAFDATKLDVAKIYVGNTAGVITPLRSLKLDNDEDGLVDLALFYSTEAARALGTGSFVPEEEQKLEEWDGPVGLHYTDATGVDYLLRNILELGPAVPLNLPTGDKRPPYEETSSSPQGPSEPLSGEEHVTALLPSYPNPFNPSTTIPFTLGDQERVVLRVYDASGKLIRTLLDGVVPAGRHDVVWDGRAQSGSQAATGIYFVRLQAGSYEATKKIVMLR